MFVICFFFLGLVLICIETSLFIALPFKVLIPNLYFILVAYLAYRHNIIRGLLILFPLNLVFDILVGIAPGVYPAMFLLAYLIFKALPSSFSIKESIYQIPFIGICFLFVHWLLYTALGFTSSDFHLTWSWPLMIMKSGLIVLLSPPLFRLFDLLSGFLEKRNINIAKLNGKKEVNRYKKQ